MNLTSNNASDIEAPSFVFVVAPPKDLAAQPPLTSSLQTLETCFFEIGFRRFPHALVSCVTAIESALKARMGISPKEECTLDSLLHASQNLSPALRTFSPEKLAYLRRTRNDIIHYGFSPKDDDKCAGLLVGTGFPFLLQCYKEFFDFSLDWRGDRKTADYGLSQLKIAEQLRLASEIHSKIRHFPAVSAVHCFTGFIHYICWFVKESYQTVIEADMHITADANGNLFEAQMRRKESCKTAFHDVNWEFDCPICDSGKSVVMELNEDGLRSGRVAPKRCICVNCDFVVPTAAPFVSEVLFAAQLKKTEPQILREFGIRV
jgi:hypothetical protein